MQRHGIRVPVLASRQATVTLDAAPGRRHWIGVAILFSILTTAATWPQIVEPAGILPHRDSWFNMWRIAWTAHQLVRAPAHLFDANIHYPERHTLAYSDAVLVPALVGAPGRWAGVPTPYVHTFLVMISFVLAGVGAWALVRDLTGNTVAGVAAGLIFAFTPFRFDHYMHLELLWSGWMPLALLAIHRALRHGRAAAGAAAGLLVAAQMLSSIYYGVYFASVMLPLVVVLATGLAWTALRRAAVSLGVGGLIAAMLILPYLAPYRAARTTVGERGASEAALYSAGPIHYLSATPDNLLYGRFADRTGRPEKRLFPGLAAALLAVIALWPPLDRVRLAYAVALLVAVDLSFGPSGLTYEWLREHVLPYRGLRAPARAGGVALLMIAVLAGFGWARIERAAAVRVGRRVRLLSASALCAVAIEYVEVPRHLVRAPVGAEPVYQWLTAQPYGVVAEFPMPEEHGLPLHDAEFEYASTFHWRPIVNGYSGNVPVSYVEMLRAMRPFPTDAGLERLRATGVRYLILHERFFGHDGYRDATAALDSRPGLIRRGPFGPDTARSVVYEFTSSSHD